MDEGCSDVQTKSGSKNEEQVIHEKLRRLDYGTNNMDLIPSKIGVSEGNATSESPSTTCKEGVIAVVTSRTDTERPKSPVNEMSSDSNGSSVMDSEEKTLSQLETGPESLCNDFGSKLLNAVSDSEDEQVLFPYTNNMLQDDSVVEYESTANAAEASKTESDSPFESSETSSPITEENGTNSSPVYESDVRKVDFSSTSKENLIRIITSMLDECNVLHQEKERLENEVDRLQADNSPEIYRLQIETLEKSLAQAQADICNWQTKLQQAEESYMAENIKIRSELTTRLERMTHQYEAANKDKESMVIKYATSEREVIVARKQKEVIEKKLKDMEKEREQLQNKNKMLVSERARLCQTLDTKVQKNNFNQREIERLKEEVNSREVEIEWAQTKLKSEMDAHKETQGKLDRALMKITKHEEELKAIKDEAEKLVRDTKENENSRANVLDMQLKEEKARLIMERKANEDKGSAFHKIQSELETLRTKHSSLVDESNSLRSRVANFEAEQEETEKLFSSLRSEVTSTRQQVADLNLQLSNSSHLQEQLQGEREQLAAANQEVERLQSLNNEIEGDLLSCRQKEAELLAFTQKLTDKNVQIQSQFSALQSKAQLLEIEREEVKTELEEVKAQKSKLKSDLTKENQNQNAQVESLRNQLAEKIEETRKLTTKISDLENEIQVLKRKHANSLKDMMREVQKLRRRLEQQDDCSIGGNGSSSGGVLSGRSSQSATPHDSLSQGSRASSNTSLHTIEYQNTNGSNVPSQETLPPLNDPLITQQVLVERIIKLQKNAAKKAEKIEFLEEHVTQLVAELKKKSRIIHHYIMKEEAGALSNSASDSSKAELIKHGGIMASVYGSAPRDGNMTLELSLEINRKLQAVLEDTLLKNITLKDNLNTLGDEIAKMTRQNQQNDPQK